MVISSESALVAPRCICRSYSIGVRGRRVEQALYCVALATLAAPYVVACGGRASATAGTVSASAGDAGSVGSSGVSSGGGSAATSGASGSIPSGAVTGTPSGNSSGLAADADAAAPIPPTCDPSGWCWSYPTADEDGGSGIVGPSVQANDVWGSGPNDVWAVGFQITQGGLRYGIVHWNGLAWSTALTEQADASAAVLESIWGSGPNDIWAVGSGIILHWDGSTWSVVETGVFGVPYGPAKVSGSAPNDVWAVGGTTALHWDGRSWSSVPTGTSASLSGVWSSGPVDAWAVGGARCCTGTDRSGRLLGTNPRARAARVRAPSGGAAQTTYGSGAAHCSIGTERGFPSSPTCPLRPVLPRRILRTSGAPDRTTCGPSGAPSREANPRLFTGTGQLGRRRSCRWSATRISPPFGAVVPKTHGSLQAATVRPAARYYVFKDRPPGLMPGPLPRPTPRLQPMPPSRQRPKVRRTPWMEKRAGARRTAGVRYGAGRLRLGLPPRGSKPLSDRAPRTSGPWVTSGSFCIGMARRGPECPPE